MKPLLVSLGWNHEVNIPSGTNTKQRTKLSTWNSFEDIEVWQLAREFCKHISVVLEYDGLKTDYALKDQLNRSSGSIMDNT